MRRAPVLTQAPPTLHVELAERLRVTTGRLLAMPPDVATSLSITTTRQGHSDADLQVLAASIATPLGLGAAVETDGESVTAIFWRSDSRHP
jgi:hypothetical protein